jgi:Flp pilus assembly protein TadD
MRIFGETKQLLVGLFFAILIGAGAYFFHNQDEIKNVPNGPEIALLLKNTVAQAEVVFGKVKTKVVEFIDSIQESQVVSVDTRVKKPSTEPIKSEATASPENPAENTSGASQSISTEQKPAVEGTNKTEGTSSVNQVTPAEEAPVVEVTKKVIAATKKVVAAIQKVEVAPKVKVVKKSKTAKLPKDDFSRVVRFNNLGKFKDAIALLDTSKYKMGVDKRKKEYFIAYTGLGTELRKKGNCKSAIDYYKKAFSINLTDPSSPLNLAGCYLAEKRSKEADQMVKEALNLSDDKSKIYFSLAQSYSDANLPVKAMQTYDKVLELAPNQWEYIYGLGHELFTLGKLDGSIKLLKAAEKISPEPSNVYWSLGMAYCKNQNGKLAREYYLKLLKTRHPKINTVANYLGKHCSKTDPEPIAMNTAK